MRRPLGGGGKRTWQVRITPRIPGEPGFLRWALEGARCGTWTDEEILAAERHLADLLLALAFRTGMEGQWQQEGARLPVRSIDLEDGEKAFRRGLDAVQPTDGRLLLEIRMPSQCEQECIFCVGNRDGPPVPVNRTDAKPGGLANCRVLLSWLAGMHRSGTKTRMMLTSSDPLNSPLLEPLLKDLAAPVVEEVFIATTGIRMADARDARWLGGLGLPIRLLMTLHGPTEEIHDFVARRSGAFREVVAALGNCREAGIPVELNHVVVRENLEHLPETLRTAARLGFRPWVSMFLGGDAIPEAVSRRNLVPFTAFGKLLEAHRDLVLETVQDFKHVPECVLPGWARHMGTYGYFGRRRDPPGSTPGACRDCPRFETTCMGPTKSYVDAFGSAEFHPPA